MCAATESGGATVPNSDTAVLHIQIDDVADMGRCLGKSDGKAEIFGPNAARNAVTNM